jgi:hypothetical protein
MHKRNFRGVSGPSLVSNGDAHSRVLLSKLDLNGDAELRPMSHPAKENRTKHVFTRS